MAGKKAKPARVKVLSTRAGAKADPTPAIGHRLHGLLLAVQRIASFEDELCALVHETTRAQTVTGQLALELRDLLASMPAHDYVHDLETLQTLLAPAARVRPARKTLKKPAPPAKKKLMHGRSANPPATSRRTRKSSR